MRHGKPSLDLEAIKSERMASARLGQIVNEYERSDLDPSYKPGKDSINIAKEYSVSISSDLPKFISSTKLLGFGGINSVDPCFRESALPYLAWNSPNLTFFTWAIIFRLAWLCGFSKNGESFKDAKLRSVLGADKLEHSAREEGTVLHVGHGIMNRLLIKELRRRKWVVKGHTGEKYWSYAVLEYETMIWQPNNTAKVF
jgi:hypothetical protein